MGRKYTVKLTAHEIAGLHQLISDSTDIHPQNKAILLPKFDIEEAWDELDPTDDGDMDWAKPDCMI